MKYTDEEILAKLHELLKAIQSKYPSVYRDLQNEGSIDETVEMARSDSAFARDYLIKVNSQLIQFLESEGS